MSFKRHAEDDALQVASLGHLLVTLAETTAWLWLEKKSQWVGQLATFADVLHLTHRHRSSPQISTLGG